MKGGETQQEKCCASRAKQYWHPSRLITLSFFTFLRLLVRTRKTSSSCPIPLQDLGSEVLFWYVAHVRDHSPFSNSTSQLLTFSYTNRVREPTPSTHDRASCLLHWRQLRRHVLGYQQVAFQEDAHQTAAISMNSPSASRLSSSH